MLGHYLMFNRNCMEALHTYEKAFGIKVDSIMKYGDAPPDPDFPVAEEDKDLVLHSWFALDNSEIMCADNRNWKPGGSNMFVNITTKDETVFHQAWNTLKEGGEIYMEPAPSFFALLHGSLQDRFGINWMFTLMK